MDILIICLLLILDIFLLALYKKLYNPAVLFTSFWIAILAAGHFRLLGEDKTSNFTYIVIFIGVFCFAVGGLMAKKKMRILNDLHKNSAEKNRQMTYTLRSKFVYLILGFAVLYSTYNLINLLPLLLNGYSIGDIRQMYLTMGSSDAINSSPFSYFVQNVVFQTCQTSCIIIGCTEYFLNKKVKWLVGALYTVLIAGLMYGSRIIFVDLLLYVTIGMIILNESSDQARKLTQKQKRMIYIGILGAIGLLVYITTIRQGKGSLWMALYSDYTCSIRLLDISIEKAVRNGDITWGVLGIAGLIEPITAILGSSLFGGLIPTPKAFMILAQYTNEFIDIGSGQMNNAYVSAFFYFFLDGRIPGVILGGVICGYMATLIYNRISSQKYAAVDLAWFLLIISMIFKSMIRFQFSIPSCAWSVILIYMAYRPVKYSEKELNKSETTYD